MEYLWIHLRNEIIASTEVSQPWMLYSKLQQTSHIHNFLKCFGFFLFAGTNMIFTSLSVLVKTREFPCSGSSPSGVHYFDVETSSESELNWPSDTIATCNLCKRNLIISRGSKLLFLIMFIDCKLKYFFPSVLQSLKVLRTCADLYRYFHFMRLFFRSDIYCKREL